MPTTSTTRAMRGWGGTLTLKQGTSDAKTIKVRNVQLTRQASEFDMTAHGDAAIYSGPGRVKRGGTFEAYITDDADIVTTTIQTPTLATPLKLKFVNSAAAETELDIIITGADQTHASDDAAMWTVTFTETMAVV